jgi:hypothetical protein
VGKASLSSLKTFVKHTGYKSHRGNSKGLRAINAHGNYLANRPGHDQNKEFFTKDGTREWGDFYQDLKGQPQKGVIAHKLVISMDRKDLEEQQIDLKELARDTMSHYEQKKGRELNWIATIHDKESNPHVHIVIAGRDGQGKEVYMKPNDLEQMKRISDQERAEQYTRFIFTHLEQARQHDIGVMERQAQEEAQREEEKLIRKNEEENEEINNGFTREIEREVFDFSQEPSNPEQEENRNNSFDFEQQIEAEERISPEPASQDFENGLDQNVFSLDLSDDFDLSK